MSDIFPLELFDNIRNHPENYRLLQRIPLTIPGMEEKFPIKLNEAEAGERVFSLVFLDTETTGINKETDKIIELGMVKAVCSADRNIILSVDKAYDAFEDPGRPIPMEVQKLTHITDDMVAGRHFNDDEIAAFLSRNTLIVAHNASFDRAFFDRRFSMLQDLSWACSLEEIPWKDYGYNGYKLEYLNLYNGWFYEAHRAYVDCLALLWLLYVKPEALKALIESANTSTYKLIVRGNFFGKTSELKKLGLRFDGSGQDKYWYCFDKSLEKIQQKQQNLELALQSKADFYAEIKELDAKSRYKQK